MKMVIPLALPLPKLSLIINLDSNSCFMTCMYRNTSSLIPGHQCLIKIFGKGVRGEIYFHNIFIISWQ